MRLCVLAAHIGHYHHARYCALYRAIHDITIVVSETSATFQEFLSDKAAPYPIVDLFADSVSYGSAVQSGEVWRKTLLTLDRIDPDVVAVAGWARPESFAAIWWAQRKGKRLVMMSASQAGDGPRHKIREAVKRRILGSCDTVLVGGTLQRAYAEALGMPSNRIFVGYNAVDNDHFRSGAKRARANARALRRQFNLPERYLLASGRFVRKKNFPRLVEAYVRAIDGLAEPPDLVILGDGPERSAIEFAITQSGRSSRIHLPGFRGYETLPTYYGLAEAFAHVSTSEQWGLVISEAAASGLPLLVSRPCGATSELVREGKNGFIVDPLDGDQIATSMRRLIEMPSDARSSMGQSSEKIVADWGPMRFASGMLEACQAALKLPKRARTLLDEVLLTILSRKRIVGIDDI